MTSPLPSISRINFPPTWGRVPRKDHITAAIPHPIGQTCWHGESLQLTGEAGHVLTGPVDGRPLPSGYAVSAEGVEGYLRT